MPSTGTAGLATVTAVVLLAGAGVGTGAIDATEDLEQALKGAVDGAMRDLAVDWLEVNDAHGTPENGTVDDALLLVRLDGTLDKVETDQVVARSASGTQLDLEWREAVRDEDGSLANGTLDSEDLVEVAIAFEDGLPADETREVTVHYPDASPLTMTIQSPRQYSDDIVRLKVGTMGQSR